MKLILGLCTLFSVAKADVKLSLAQPVIVEYRSPTWNKYPHSIESGWILIRDENTDRMISVELTETSENSGLFRGTVQLSFNDISEIDAEVYVIPPDLMLPGKPAPDFDDLIDQEKIAKKVIRLKQLNRKFAQVLGVYDSHEAEVQSLQDDLSAGTVVERAALEAQLREKERQARLKNATAVATQEADRLRMEMAQKAKIEEAQKAQAAMAESERKERRAQAAKFGEMGMREFEKGKFPEAQRHFEKATELDPDNRSYFFQYGVTLYRLNKYNNSIVALNLAAGKTFNPAERDYFLALDYVKLNDNEKALQLFNSVRDKKDKTLSPSAAFFAGATLYKMEKYEESKHQFEFVLDQSNDPTLDKQADAYIDQIGNILAFNAQRAKKILITFNLNEMYDSDILNQAAQQSPTALNGFRTAYGGSIEYRPIYTQSQELSGIFSANDMYSLNTSFKPDHNLQSTDPLVIDISLPYKYKGKLFGKPYQLTVTPTNENIYMDVDPNRTGIGGREMIISSNILKFDNTFVMRDDYFATYSLEARHDDSFIANTPLTAVANLTGNKITLSTSQILFKNKKKTEAAIYDASIAVDNAKGADESYQRLDAGFGYLWPAFSDSSVNGRLGLFYAKYPSNEFNRLDKGELFNASFRKPITPTWASVTAFSFSLNGSNTAANNYNKFTLSTGVAYSGGF